MSDMTLRGRYVCNRCGEREATRTEDVVDGRTTRIVLTCDECATDEKPWPATWYTKGYLPGEEVPANDTRGGAPLWVVNPTTATMDGQDVDRTAWCECQEQGTQRNPHVVAYEDPAGPHGFACGSCRKLVQVG